jgi:hypothetical protein
MRNDVVPRAKRFRFDNETAVGLRGASERLAYCRAAWLRPERSLGTKLSCAISQIELHFSHLYLHNCRCAIGTIFAWF